MIELMIELMMSSGVIPRREASTRARDLVGTMLLCLQQTWRNCFFGEKHQLRTIFLILIIMKHIVSSVCTQMASVFSLTAHYIIFKTPLLAVWQRPASHVS